MAIVKISDLPLVDQPVEGTDLFVVVQDNVTKKAYASDIQTYVGFEEFQTATAGQTVFNLTTMTYAAGANNLQVFVDGVNQYVGTSYLETDNNTVTFTQGLHVGALVKFSTVQTLSTVDTSSEDILFTQGGVGAVTRSVQSKERDIISVRDFGAVGNGVIDDTVAIQTAYNYLASIGGGQIIWPKGNYRVTGTIYFSTNIKTNLMRSTITASNQTIFETGYWNGTAIVSNVGTPVGDYSTAVFRSSIGNGVVLNCSRLFRLNKSLADTRYHDIEVQNYTGINDTQMVYATECFFSNFARLKYFGFDDGIVTGTANTTSGNSTITMANATAAKLSAGWIIRNHFTADILPTEITVVSVGGADSGGAGLANVVISQNANVSVSAGAANSGFIASKPNYVPMYKFETANSNIVMEKLSGVARFVAFDLSDFNSSTIISPDIESSVGIGFRLKNCVGVTFTGMYTEAIYHTLFDVSQGGNHLDIGPANYFQVAGIITAGASGSVSGSILLANNTPGFTPYGFTGVGSPIINLSSANASMFVMGGPTDIKTQNPSSKSQYVGQYGLALPNVAGASPTTMDWYEEGTWTPVIEGSTSAGTGTYTTQYGRFTRIGNRVFYNFTVSWSAHTGTGIVSLANLPYITTILTARSFPVSVTGTSGSQFYMATGGTGWLKPELVSVDATGVASNVNIYSPGTIIGIGHYEV
jgi:hypothetical protein